MSNLMTVGQSGFWVSQKFESSSDILTQGRLALSRFVSWNRIFLRDGVVWWLKIVFRLEIALWLGVILFLKIDYLNFSLVYLLWWVVLAGLIIGFTW